MDSSFRWQNELLKLYTEKIFGPAAISENKNFDDGNVPKTRFKPLHFERLARAI